MIRGFDILCISTSPWDTPYGSRQEIMSRLAQANRVLFVEYQAHWFHLFRYRRLRPSAGCVPGQLRHHAPGLWVYTPPLGLPGGLYVGWINRWNQGQLLRSLRPILRRLGFHRPILWIYAPQSALLLGEFGERLAVYHCIDAFQEEKPNRRYRYWMQRYGYWLALCCDCSMADSRFLHRWLIQWDPAAVWMPPGIDRATFNPGTPTPTPRELAEISTPILGYVGSLDHRIDLELLEAVARRFPHATLVLLGPVHEQTDVRRLRKFPNVRVIGEKPKRDVPAFLQRMDVCLIPFRVVPFTQANLPLKLFEYLAIGKPVVSTALPELEPYGPMVAIASGRAEFLERLQAALAHGAAGRAERAAAPWPSWQDQVERMSGLVEDRLARRCRDR